MSTPRIDAIYDWADAITLVMERYPNKTWSPSEVARKAHITSVQAGHALDWMEADAYVVGQGTRSWRRYRLRNSGERRTSST
jgi:hypothetical protein